jgi:putative two-component system response regulator
VKILIVDDDPITLTLLAETIKGLGHEVTTAQDGREALDLMRNGSYRMMVCDWEMP